jgi:hypothetical protein
MDSNRRQVVRIDAESKIGTGLKEQHPRGNEMAKAKKSEAAPAAAGAAKKKPAKAKDGAPAVAPLVDTNLAAEAAAKRVVAGLAPAATGSSLPMKESASFKHMKDSLNKPASGLAGMLDKTAGPSQKHSTTPFHGGKQLGRNQTFGADVNRTGVPRRTGGG